MTILTQSIKNCHWLVNDNFSLYKEWVNAENCHWPVNDNLEVEFKIVIDSFALQLGYHRKLSLTGQWQFWSSLFKTVVDRSITILKKSSVLCIKIHLAQKIVIDQSMTILEQSTEN